jgi:hypothetical protein
MRRSRVPSNGPGRFFAAQFSAGCTTNTSAFDFRQAQACRKRQPLALGEASGLGVGYMLRSGGYATFYLAQADQGVFAQDQVPVLNIHAVSVSICAA